MKHRLLKKSLGLLLAFCMLATLFICVPVLPASATTNSKMFYINGNQTNLQVQLRYNGDTFKYVAGEQYVFTCRCRSDDHPEYLTRGKMFHFGYYNTSDSLAIISPSTATFTESYDAEDHVYTATFTVPSNCRSYTNTYFYFGDRSDNLSGYTAYFTDFVITRVSTDTVTAFPTVSSGNVYNSSISANDKYRIPSGQTGKVLVQDVPKGYFDRAEDLVTFSHTNSYACLLYMKSWSTLPAGNYRFEMDCKAETGTPYVHINCRGSEEIAAMTDIVKTYDRVNYKYVLTFTLTSSWTEVLGVRVGSWNGYAGTDLRCAHPTLYLLDANGDPTGSSLINTFSEKYYASSGTPGNPSSERDVWFRAPSDITYSKIPADAFEPSGERMIRFPAVTPSYQVLTYKDSYLHLNAGTYRFTIDQYNASGSGTVNLWSGTNIGDAISKTSDQLIGNSRIVTFTLNSAITGFGIFIGNYSGSYADVYFKKPMLYKVENGVATGFSLIKPINTQTLVLKAGLTRAGIDSGKWSSINYQSGNITADYISEGLFNAPTFKSRSLVLDDDIGINFTVNLSALSASQLSNCQMNFAITNDKTYTQELSKAENLGEGLYRFTCNLTSVQMAETVTPTLSYGAASLTGEPFSVRNYVDYIIANDHNVKLRTLVKTMNDYGYYSQQYLQEQHGASGATSAVKISGSTYSASDFSAAASALSGRALTKNTSGSAVTGVQYNINFGSAIFINLKLLKSAGESLSVSVAPSGVLFEHGNMGGYYLVRLNELPILDLGKAFTVTGSGTSNSTAFSVTLSGLSYVYAILNSTSTTTAAKNAVMALYDYYNAASAYSG